MFASPSRQPQRYHRPNAGVIAGLQVGQTVGPPVARRTALWSVLLLHVLWLAPLYAEQAEQSDSAAEALQTAELALRTGDCRSAVEAYLDLARQDRDPRASVRAIEVARACRHLPAAWAAAARLRELDGENPQALRLVGTIALETFRIDAAREIFSELLAKPDVEPDRALADILPALAEGEAAVAAWMLFKDLVDAERAGDRVLLPLARMACAADALRACLALIDEARERGVGRDSPSIRLAALAAAGAGLTERALEEARLVSIGDPAEHRFAEIETLISLHREDEAREALLRIEQRADEYDTEQHAIEADRRLALLALARGDLAEAERRFGQRLSSDEGAGEALFYLGTIAERRGRADAALQGYRQLIAAGAGLPVRARTARLLLARGELDAAMQLYDEMLRSFRVDAIQIELSRARVLSEAALHDEALSRLDKALQRYPEHPELRYYRAVLLDAAGRQKPAIEEFERLLAARPADPAILNALGYTLADRRRQLPRAERLIRSALAQRPDNAAFLDSLAWVRFRRGDRASALPLLERAWRLSREPEIAAHWGEVLWVSGARAEARTVWAQGLVIAPDSKPLRATIERYAGALPGESTP